MAAEQASARRPHLAAGLFLALLATAMLWRGCVLGEIPYDASFQGHFRPWRSEATATIAAGVAALAPQPERDRLDRFRVYWSRLVHDDVVLSVWPDQIEVTGQVRHGTLPLWNPHVLAGAPLLANGMSNPFFPASWPSYLLPGGRGRSVTLWLHLVLAGVAFYGLLVDRKRSPLAAATGAAAYMLNPVFVGWLYYGTAVPVMGIVPLALVALFRLGTSVRPWRAAALVAALTGLELYAGNMQFVLYALVAQAIAGVYILLRHVPRARLQVAAWMIGATVVGVLSASVVVLPFLELQANAYRAPDKYASLNFLPPGQLMEWLFPRFYGHPGNGDYVGGFFFFRPYSTMFGGPSAVALVLAVVGGSVQRRARLLALLTAAAVAALMALAWTPVHAVARAILPGLDALDVMRGLVLVHFGLAFLAAEGVEALQAEPRRAARVLLVWAGFVLACVAALDGVGLAVASSGRFVAHLSFLRRHGSALLAPRLVWPLAATLLLWLWARVRTRAAPGLPGLVALPTVLLAVELLALARPSMRTAAADQVVPVSPSLATLQRVLSAEPGRVAGLTEADTFPRYSGDNLPPNTAGVLGMEDLRGYVPLPSLPMLELLSAAAGRPFAAAVTFSHVDLPLFELLGLEHVLSSTAPRSPHFRSDGDGVWTNLHARQAFFTPCIQVEPDAGRRVAALVSPEFRPFAAAWVEAPVAGVRVCSDESAAGAVAVNRPSPGQVRLQVQAATDGVLVLADAWFPGWKASVDGVPQEILRVDHALRGVAIPPGTHVVDFAYRPDSLAEGALWSLAALILIVAAGLWERRPRLQDDLLMGLAATVLLAAFAWRDPLPNDNDALYAAVMRGLREMPSLRWLQVEGAPFLDKPPLFFWAGALLTAILGDHEFVFRMPALFAGVMGVVLTTRIARRLSGSRTAGLLAGALLLASPTYFDYARRVYMEVPVAVAGLWAFDLGLRERWKSAGLWSGVAFMLKSLVGLLGLAALAVAHLARRRLPRGLLVASALALAVAMPWHLLAYLRSPAIFLDFTVRLHVVDQIATAQPWSTGGPLFYLFSMLENDPLLLAGLLAGLAAAVVRLRRERNFELLAVVLAVVVQLALYNLSATKKPFYLLTVYPLVAVLAARAVGPWLDGNRRRATLALCVVAASFVLLCGPLVRPDPSTRESTFLRPLAKVAATLTAPGEPIYALDTYLAAPQFYAHRPVRYAVRTPSVQAMLSRIPYLRYANNVVVWDDQLVRGGKLVIAEPTAASALLARMPGATVIARNEAFWLVRGPS